MTTAGDRLPASTRKAGETSANGSRDFPSQRNSGKLSYPTSFGSLCRENRGVLLK